MVARMHLLLKADGNQGAQLIAGTSLAGAA
jgi:hypothetical protein